MSELTQADVVIIIKDIVIAFAALGGLFLGLYNLWRDRQKDKVKLKIIPQSLKLVDPQFERIIRSENEFSKNSSQKFFAFDITNLSQFSITIAEAGMSLKVTNKRLPAVSFLKNPYHIEEGLYFPIELKSRDKITGYVLLEGLSKKQDVAKIKAAYVSTSCGHVAEGKSKALDQMVQYLVKEREKLL